MYAGIGGNRRFWDKEHTGLDLEVTAVEIEPKIAKIYQDFFPQDKVIVADAHQYLLEHFKEFNFIWSSPPCPTHSRIFKNTEVAKGSSKPIYPDMKLWQEILFLKHYFKGKYCIENVISFYKPIILPQECGGHYFWANFFIKHITINKIHHGYTKEVLQKSKGFDLTGKDCGHRKDQVLRNCVFPELGLHILNESKRDIQPELFRTSQ